jgi:hypothetical protein
MKWIIKQDIGVYKKRIDILLPIAIRKEPDFIEDKILESIRVDLINTEKGYNYLIDKNKDDLKTVLGITKEFFSYILSIISIKLTYCMLEINISQEAVEYRKQLYESGLMRSLNERVTVRILMELNAKENGYASVGLQPIEIKKIIEKRFSSDGVYQKDNRK